VVTAFQIHLLDETLAYLRLRGVEVVQGSTDYKGESVPTITCGNVGVYVFPDAVEFISPALRMTVDRSGRSLSELKERCREYLAMIFNDM
jgi:hypothetical protein